MIGGMEMRNIPISQLQFAAYNPRKISKDNFERLRASIHEFGFTVPCTVNMHPGREYVLIAGHMRTRAAEVEGLTEVPCFIVDLPEAKERMLNIALNNPNLGGTWDETLLSEMVVKLQEDGENIALTGFDDEQLARVMDGDAPMGKPVGENARLDTPTETDIECPRCRYKITV